jgi:Zn-dependent peptidase ImmA (M78 family)
MKFSKLVPQGKSTIGVDGDPYLNAEFVKQQARKLIESSGMEKPPFSIERLAMLQGIKKIIRTDLGRLDGLLIKLEEGYLIKLNSMRPSCRQNFSCAHEIIHTFFDDPKIALRQRPRIDSSISVTCREREEVLCDIGAAELLMPEPIFQRYASYYSSCSSALQPLARSFGVSIQAVAIRLTEVKKEPYIAICWNFREGPSSAKRKLRVMWAAQPRKVMGERHYYVPRGASIDQNSSVFRAYQTDIHTADFQILRLGSLRGRYYVESMGFGSGARRYVISFVHLNSS